MAEENLTGKVIVITGASSGFGKGTALELAKRGAYVVLAARRENLLDELAQECESLGGRALSVPTDVSSQEDVMHLAEATISTFGKIDVWINNAGSGAIGRFTDIPIADHVQVIQTDLIGTIYGSYCALKQFQEQGYGNLINVASVIGKVPAPYFASYTAAKHGVVGLSASLRQELDVNDLDNIHVCTVMPTSMDTPFFEHAADYTGHKVVPIPPVYEPEQVINTLVDLVSHPEAEVSVGGVGGASFVFMHNLVPGLTEKMMAKLTHHEQMEKAPVAGDAPGSVREPMPTGAGVSGGLKQP